MYVLRTESNIVLSQAQERGNIIKYSDIQELVPTRHSCFLTLCFVPLLAVKVRLGHTKSNVNIHPHTIIPVSLMICFLRKL